MLKRDPSSYRDPQGYIAREGDDIFRIITNDNAPVIDETYNNFFKTAVDKGFLVPFERADAVRKAPDGITSLRLKTLPLITYPYEWGFAQLKDAALRTLDLCLLALEYGLTLKDATAFNMQMHKGRMIFIDHTSFEPTDNRLPWKPYSQFCRHFLVPLLITSRRGYHANKAFRTELDGLSLQDACIALPFRDRFKPSIFFHIYLHHRMVKRHQADGAIEDKIDARKTINKRRGKEGSQRLFLEHLKNVVSKIKPPRYATEWHDYYQHTNYDQAAFSRKEEIIKKTVSGGAYKTVWDMGANNGHFSRLVSEHAETVVSMDIDYAAIDYNYRMNAEQVIDNIYPLVMDISNPSPALGFGNNERLTIAQRSTPDLIIALALVHHLTVTYNIPFAMQAEQFRSHDADLLVEYVGRDDSQFQKLLFSKDESYDHYNQDEFEACFAEHFILSRKTEIEDTHRCLYHFTPR